MHILACSYYGISKLDSSDAINAKFEANNLWEKYVGMMYFAATMIFTIGFGDISCTTTVSRIFFIFITFFNIVIFGYLMADLTSCFTDYLKDLRTETISREDYYY